MSILISAENCEYVAEGNVGIVVRLVKEEKVLRLKKQDNDCKTIQKAHNILTELENQIKVIELIFKPILGAPFVQTPHIMFLKTQEIKLLKDVVAKFRPDYRRHKTVVEGDAYVLVMPDFCCLPQSLKHIPTDGSVLSIEIKPKQGFVKEEYLPNGLSSFLLPICRCCMMKGYKLKNKDISTKCGYCPTGLFSGCYTRMFHAMKMLCKTPQNNLRIFKNQKLIFSEENKGDLNEILADFFIGSEKFRHEDVLCDLLLRVLTKSFPHETYKNPLMVHKKFLQNCINAHDLCTESDCSHVLPLGSVLERLLNAELLDNIPMVDLYQLYMKLNNRDDLDFVGCCSRYEIPPHMGLPERTSNESEYQYASRKVWEFLMSLTVKDCSIILTLSHIANSYNIVETENVICDMLGNKYVFSIALVDLDMKVLSKVEKVYKDTHLILESALNP